MEKIYHLRKSSLPQFLSRDAQESVVHRALRNRYLPIGSLPSSVQTVIKLFPVSYSASFFRQIS